MPRHLRCAMAASSLPADCGAGQRLDSQTKGEVGAIENRHAGSTVVELHVGHLHQFFKAPNIAYEGFELTLLFIPHQHTTGAKRIGELEVELSRSAFMLCGLYLGYLKWDRRMLICAHQLVRRNVQARRRLIEDKSERPAPL